MALPILTVEAMRAWEAATWAAGGVPEAVILRVGKRLADSVLSRSGPADRILILAGRGHNGDDARAAVSHLEQGDREVRVVEVLNPAIAREAIEALDREGWRPRWVVDGVFGIGLNRDLDPTWREFIDRLNQTGWPVVAVDVPSGLDASTGQPRGAAVRARWTLTVGAPKVGLVESHAAEFVGRLEVLSQVGLLPLAEVAGAGVFPKSDLAWVDADEFVGFPPDRLVDSHKGSNGHVVVVAGSLGFHGAAVLAARGASAARPGLVTVLTTGEAYLPIASQVASPMVRTWDPTAALPATSTVLVVGPGLAGSGLTSAHRDCVIRWWTDWAGPMVVDASALDWISAAASPRTGALRVLTPHPGEAARWLGWTAAEIQSDRSRAVRQLASRGAWVVLKGHQTRTGTQTGPIWVNSSGNPGLAQGGTGDVLAGFLGGCLASLRDPEVIHRTIAYAVWEHGFAADRLEARSRNWRAEELAAELRRDPGAA